MATRFARWSVDRTWDGEPLATDECADVALSLSSDTACIEVDAPYHGDPAPPGKASSLEGLWTYEVVELFLVGGGAHYVEIELSPHGHYLALAFHEPRRRIQSGLPIRVDVQRGDTHWHARAELDPALLPTGLRAANAFAIHGIEPRRRYLAAHPLGGEEPDFHRIDAYPVIDWQDPDKAVTRQ